MLTITLPLPPADLSPNARVHWAKRAKAIKRCRYDAGLVALHEIRQHGIGEPWPRVYVWPTFYFRTGHRRDKDNLAAMLKSSYDGLVDAGLVVDDRHLTPMPPEIRVDKNDPRVELRCMPEQAATATGGKM